MPRVLCLGDVNIDILLYVDSLPSLGSEILAEYSTVSPGGAAANTAVALARLGVSTGFIGCIGEDPLGWALREDFRREGVDISLLASSPEDSTGFVVVVVTKGGERTMLGYRGANRRLKPSDVRPGYFEGAQLLFVSGYALLEETQKSAAIKAVEIAKERGLKVVMDASEALARLGWERVRDYVGKIDVLLANEREIELLTGGGCGDELVGKLADVVVVKKGAEGAVAYSEGCEVSRSAFEVQVVDTTGAGDAFNAGFIFAYLCGLPLGQSLVVANAVAGFKCEGKGARHLPDPPALFSFLQKRGEKRVAEIISTCLFAAGKRLSTRQA